MRTVPILILVLSAAACGSSPPADPPVSPAVFERIEAMDRCPDLQEEFDVAESHGNAEVMRAADDRMREIGCH